jgi:hypothetical protein
MVNIWNKDHFKEAIKFAKTLSKESKNSFLFCIHKLNRIKRNCNEDLTITPDFVKHSFGFCFTKDGKRTLGGGMILHGFEETFSVELTSERFPHWSIHT